MKIFREHLYVLKKASGSWAEPYSLAPLLVRRGILVYFRYTICFFDCWGSDLDIHKGIPVIENDI